MERMEPINMNRATLNELMLIKDIGKKRAQIILDLRTEQGMLTLEDVKKLTEIQSTLWDPLVKQGAITFESDFEDAYDKFQYEEYINQEILKRDKEIEGMRKEFSSALHNIKEQMAFQKENFEMRLRQAEKEKDDTTAELVIRLTEAEQRNENLTAELTKYRQIKTEGLAAAFPTGDMISAIAPGGVYRSVSPHHGAIHKAPLKDKPRPDKSKAVRHDDEDIQRKSKDGPAPPKMSTYDGKNDWRPYHLQFSRIAGRYGWTEDQCLDKLIECLRDRALKYFSTRTRAIQQSYPLLCEKMNERFGKRDMPQIVRRQLQDLRQLVDESLEEFAERAQELASDGFPNSPDSFIEIVAVDAFLKGCIDKNSAFVATNRDPKSVDEALQLVKGAMTNYKVIYGSKKQEVRRVSFDDDEDQTSAIRKLNIGTSDKDKEEYRQLQKQWEKTERDVQDLRAKLNRDVQEIKTKLGTVLEVVSRSSRSRSPTSTGISAAISSPNKQSYRCFNCNEEGHFASECPHKNRNRSPSPRRILQDTRDNNSRYRSPFPKRDLNG